MPSISANVNSQPGQPNQKEIFDSLLADITAVRTALNTLATKLNADATVTDTNYAAAAALTTTA